MGRTEPKRRPPKTTESKTLKLKLQQRQKFIPHHEKKIVSKPKSIMRDEYDNVKVPEHVPIDNDELALFREIEAKLALSAAPKLEKAYEEFTQREARENPAKDPEVIEVYTKIGQLLRSYRSGKLPQSFAIVPRVENWKPLLELTEPKAWTPHAFYEAVKNFVACAESDRTLEFYQLYLLPRVLKDIQESKQLNYHLFKAVSKALYRPSSFFQGIVLAFMDEPQTTLRQAEIIAAVFRRKTVPKLHLAAALLQAMEKPFTAPNNYVVKALIDKKTALPQSVIARFCEWFISFGSMEREQMPVMWHQTLLSFVRSYQKHIPADERKKLISFVKKRFCHEDITPEIIRAFHDAPPNDEQPVVASEFEME